MKVVILGCGYVGIRLAKHLVTHGHEVYGIRRFIHDIKAFESASIIPLSIDITNAESLHTIPRNAQWIINAVSSSKGGVDAYRNIYLEGTQLLVHHLLHYPHIKHYIHISSTSVYGQTDGSWVNESSSRKPISKTGQILVQMEDFLMDQCCFPTTIVRASGIYGSDRSYLLDQYVKGEARMVGEGMRYLNMIYVEDLVFAIYHILQKALPGTIYNVSDIEPVTQKRFFTWLSKRLGKPLPPAASSSELARRKRALTNKRVSSHRLRNELGYEFVYPSFREGYADRIASLHI